VTVVVELAHRVGFETRPAAVGVIAVDVSQVETQAFTNRDAIGLGDRIKFWGSRGAFWGLFFGGLFLASPVTGPVVVLGSLATIIVADIENAFVVGGVAALAAALYSIGVPKDSVIQYESALKADSFLVMARCTKEEIARSKTILGATNPSRLDIHRDADAVAPATSSVPAAA